MLTRPQFTAPAFLARYRAAAAVLALFVIATVWTPFAKSVGPRYGAMITARRPLVMVNGQIAQLPAGDTLSIDGLAVTSFTDTGPFALSGSITPTALAGSVDNYNPTGLSTTSLIRQDASVASTITGLVAQSAGTEIVVQNISTSNSITLSNESASSTAANRFTFANAQDWVIPPGGSVWLRYSGSSTRWRPASSPAGNGYFSSEILTGALNWSGSITPTAISGTLNDYNPTGLATAQVIKQDLTGPASLTGLASGSSGGKIVVLANISATNANTITLVDGGSASSSVNRFYLSNSADHVIPAQGAAILRWSTGIAQWQLLGDIPSAAFELPGMVSPTAFTGGGANDYNPTGLASATTLLQDVNTSAETITGLAGGFGGRVIYLVNISTSQRIVLTNEDALSGAANRFTLPGAVSLTILPGNSVQLLYNATASRWRVIGQSYGAGTNVPEIDATGTVTATATSGTVNNWDPAATGTVSGLFVARESPTAALTLTGMIAGATGQLFMIRNSSATAANTITLNNESASSTAANRFTLPNAASVVISAGSSCLLRYAGTTSRWEPVDGACGQSTMTTIPGASLTVTDTGTQNDYNPTGLGSTSILLANAASGLTITGLAGGQDGRTMAICNISANTMTLSNEAAGSTAANRFDFANSNNISLQGGGTNKYACAQLMYIGSLSRWISTGLPMSSNQQIVATFAGGLTSNSTTTVGGGNLVLSTTTGVVQTNGTAPTLSSCGTSPSMTGSSISGRVTTGTTNTGCTLTWAATYSTVPACVCSTENVDSTFKCVPSATALVVTYASNSGNIFDYHCFKN